MVTLAGILFQMSSREIDRLHIRFARLGFHTEGHLAALHNRMLKLADLVALGQIGVKIVLTIEDGTFGHLCTDGKTKLGSALYRTAVQNGQSARQRQINVASLRVGLSSEMRAGTGKNLRIRGELNVRLQTDHNFPLHDVSRAPRLKTFGVTQMPVGRLLPGVRDAKHLGLVEAGAGNLHAIGRPLL